MRKKSLFFILCSIILITFSTLIAGIEGKEGFLSTHLSGIQMMGGDEASQFKTWGGFGLGYYLNRRLGIELTGAAGWVRPGQDEEETSYRTYLYPVTLSMRYNIKPDAKLMPYAAGGFGILYWGIRDVTDEDQDLLPFNPEGHYVGNSFNRDIFVFLGGGFQYFLTSIISIDVSARYNYLTEHEYDMSGYGDEHSAVIEGRLGINFALRCDIDKDGDGIYDKDDLDPDNPEDFDGFEDLDGAPDYDNDNDGVYDVEDGAPNDPEDIDGYQDADGVPDPDNDNDGILDVDDLAPRNPEDFDGYKDEDGAPDFDNDGDGILDVNDKCPNQPETFNEYMDDDGCPDKKPEVVFEEKAPIILEGVNFATSSADLTEEAKIELEKVVTTLVDYPEIKLDIHGYTDDRGDRDYNISLSQQRAESVMNYLVSRGIDPARMTAKGFGPDNPIDTNDTKEGRAKNRRIEFIRAD
ncbi:MAG: OmpA family protein [Candidatus Cloacimonetes bacterium]|nr:OmpA family protein [Candidatus Cloacimonadota bacterium]